jgi:uroporphyrinogen III methyltransferase/synthase
MEIDENKDHMEFDSALLNLDRYRWLTFTSTNAVTIFFQRLAKLRIDHRRLSHLFFAVVGSGTAKALRQYGYQADLVPQQYTTAGLAQELINTVKPGEYILILRAKQGSEVLTKELDRNKIPYEDIKIYDVISGKRNTQLQEKQLKQLDYLTFASSSGVCGFVNNLKITPAELPEHTKVVCIGEVTGKTLSEYGFEKVLIAGEASVEGLIECILEDSNKADCQVGGA